MATSTKDSEKKNLIGWCINIFKGEPSVISLIYFPRISLPLCSRIKRDERFAYRNVCTAKHFSETKLIKNEVWCGVSCSSHHREIRLLSSRLALHPVAKHIATVRDDAFVWAVLVLPIVRDDRCVGAAASDTVLGACVVGVNHDRWRWVVVDLLRWDVLLLLLKRRCSRLLVHLMQLKRWHLN